MLRALALLSLLALAACGGRPLAPGERALAADLFGPAIDIEKVRVAQGFGTAPPPAVEPPRPVPVVKRRLRPGICDRTAPAPPEGPPPAWALYNTIHFARPWYRADTAPGWPGHILLPQALILAHELVHVWQWQHRRLTGYRPLKAALESVFNLDPYFYVPAQGGGFLDYGFEQQASLLEDYLCYAIFDPANPRRASIRAILAPYFRVDRIDTVLAR